MANGIQTPCEVLQMPPNPKQEVRDDTGASHAPTLVLLTSPHFLHRYLCVSPLKGFALSNPLMLTVFEVTILLVCLWLRSFPVKVT